MVVFNPLKREIDIKIVYYGPALCGKTTNIQAIHKVLHPQQRGELVSLATKDDRTLFFDFLPIELDGIKGFKTRFHIYTVPGQIFYALTRRAVLTGVDGVIFVADSQADKVQENIESLNDLKENLKYYKKEIASLPFVIQYNKRDLENALPVEELEKELNILQVPSFVASAIGGKGVMETLTMCCRMVLKQIKDKSRVQKVAEIKEAAKERDKRVVEEVISELPRLKLIEAAEGREPAAEDRVLRIKEEEGTEPYDQSEVIEEVGREEPLLKGTTLRAEQGYGVGSTERVSPIDEVKEKVSRKMLDPEQEIKLEVPLPIDTQKVERRRESERPLAAEAIKPSIVIDEDGKRTCPRCSLKFKPNVKQCPICKISLVPEQEGGEIQEYARGEGESKDEIRAQEREFPLDATPVVEQPIVEEAAESVPVGETVPEDQGVEIVACGQPKKISPTAIKIPLIMKIGATEQEFMINLSINFEDFMLRSPQ